MTKVDLRVVHVLTLVGIMSFYDLFGESISSAGLSSALTPHVIAQFSLFTAIVLAWVLVCGKLGEWLLKLPAIASQIMAGIVLGPSCFNIAGWAVFHDQIPLADGHTEVAYLLPSTDLYIAAIALVSAAWTVSYLLWIAGHETDLKDIYHIGFVAVLAGFLGAVFPIGITALGMYAAGVSGWSVSQMIGLGLAFAATSVSIPVAMLVAYDKMHLRSSKATLGAAIIDDILAVVFLSLYFIGVQSGLFGDDCHAAAGGHCLSLIRSLIYMAIAFVVIGMVGVVVKPIFLRWLQKHRATDLVAPVAQISMQLHFAFAELVGGIAGITGAYFSGLFHKQGDPTHQAQGVFSPYVHAVLLPLFLGSIGLQIDVSILTLFDWLVVALLLAGAIISKLAGCYAATWASDQLGTSGSTGWSTLETYLFGASMVARGEVGLVVASVLYSAKVLMLNQYVIAIVVIVATTVAAPIMLAAGFARRADASFEGSQQYAISLGQFPILGTEHVFTIILAQLESAGMAKTVVEIGQGRRVVNSQGQHVEIMIDPNMGITCTGDRAAVMQLMAVLKHNIGTDLHKLSARS